MLCAGRRLAVRISGLIDQAAGGGVLLGYGANVLSGLVDGAKGVLRVNRRRLAGLSGGRQGVGREGVEIGYYNG